MAKAKKVRFDIDHEKLKHLYVNKRYNLRQLQKEFNICGEHLRATLDYLDIPKHKPTGMPKRKISDYDYYINQQQSWYRRGANRRGFEYNLTRDEFKTLIESDCHYCGQPPSTENILNRINENTFYRSGIDRVDSNKGYISSNVVPCCKICNMAKNDMSEQSFYGWVNRAYHHINRKEE